MHESGNPSALAWWNYVVGEAIAATDPHGALAAYTAAIEHASRVDNRLLVMLARSSAVTLLDSLDSPAAAFAEFERVLDQWADVGNEASQWWMLFSLAEFLVRVGGDQDAALLAGAVLSHRDRHPAFVRDRTRLDDALATVRTRLGDALTEATLEEGARLSFEEAVARARRAIRRLSGPSGANSSDLGG